MMSELGHQEAEELLGAYVLDAVDPDERRAVEEHLARCPRCRSEVDNHREVAAALGNTSAEAPSEVWDRILAGMGAEWQERAEGPAATEPDAPRAAGPAVGPPAELPLTLRRRLTPVQGSRSARGADRKRGPLRRVAVVATAAVVVVVTGLAVALANAEGQLGRQPSALSGRGVEAGVLWALAQPDHETAPLRSASGRQVAQIVVAGGNGFLVSDELQPLPGGRTYQLWGLIGGRPISLGLLGRAPAAAGFSLGTARPSTIMVTV